MLIDRFEKNDHLSHVVRAGSHVYIAAQIPDDPSGDAAHQIRQVLAKIDRCLELGGAARSDVVQAIVWLKDMNDRPAINSAWSAWVGSTPPARACIQADLAHPDALVAIMVTAFTSAE